MFRDYYCLCVVANTRRQFKKVWTYSTWAFACHFCYKQMFILFPVKINQTGEGTSKFHILLYPREANSPATGMFKSGNNLAIQQVGSCSAGDKERLRLKPITVPSTPTYFLVIFLPAKPVEVSGFLTMASGCCPGGWSQQTLKEALATGDSFLILKWFLRDRI